MNRSIITTTLLALASATALCGTAMAADSDSSGVRSRADVEAEAVIAARQAAVSIDPKSRVAPSLR